MWFHSSPAWLLLLVLGTIIYSSDGFNPLFLFDNRLIETEYGQKAELSLNSKEERLRLHLRHPIPIYGRLVEEITVFRNGLIALDDSSAENVPRNYPADTVHTGERLQELDGRYFSVFSTVNDGLKGSVTVREIDQSENLSLGCVNTKQIERFLLIIRKSYPLDEGFQWKSIFSVTWANVTNSAQSMDKVNSYTVVIFTDGVHSYSFIQYWDINWPEKDVISSGALPPEAGIFMRPLGGYQLPRSNHSVDVELWSDESNVASPGEWLVPLSELPITTDEIVRSLPEMYTQFLESLENACGFGPHLGPEEVSATDFTNSEILTEVMNDSPKDKQLHESTEPAGWYSEDYSDEDDDSLYASELPAPTISTEQQTEITDEVHGSTDALIASETEIVYEPSTQLPQGVYDEDESRFYKTESTIIPKTVLPLDETQLPGIHSQPNEYPANYPERSDYHTSTYSQSVERCDASVECADPHSECHRFAGVSCCICREGYYGSGKSHCWREDTDHKFAFNGSLNTHLESAGRPLTLTAYVDVQHGAVGRSSSGVRGGHPNDPVYQTIRILTPMFHILNSLISSSCPNNTGGQANDVPEYSLFTLSGGLRSTLVLQFFFDIEHVGRLTATCRFRLDVDSNSVYSRGSIQIDVTKSETIALISRPYREAQGVTGEGNKSYYAKYYIDQYGRIVFPGESVRFVAEQRATDELEAAKDELMVHWTGVADVQHESTDDYSSSCLLQSGSPIPRTHSFYIRLKDRGYCSEDCSAQDGSCNLFCVDEPLLFSHEPNSCDCVHCEHAGEHCVTDGATYHCTCKPGLRRMDDKSCQADTPVPDVPYIKEQCGSVQCHPHARCIQPEQGFCQCLPGYRGDGIRRCDDDPCSRCRRNEVCTGDACVPSGANLCDGVQCGRNAFCHDGACVCTAGYTGDPRVECIEERDLCAGVQCHRFGQCYENRCYCSHGYVGDGVNFCDPRTEDPCQGVRCADHAHCDGGRCSCDQNYEGDGHSECRLAKDKCADVQCHERAQCYDGRCRCLDGYEGDGYYECKTSVQDPCSQVQCHQYAECRGGQCHCLLGYEGDGYYDCRPVRSEPDRSHCDNCRGIPYKELAQCVDGRCTCTPGFVEAQPGLCVECVQDNCHRDALCMPNKEYNGAYSCQCKPGFTGNGISDCHQDGPGTSPVDRTCGGGCRVRNAECNPSNGTCVCRRGYDGDGQYSCIWNCQLCLPNAICDRENEGCTCQPGYYGDGKTYCEPIPTTPAPVKVTIAGQGQTLRLTDLDRPLELRCYVSARDDSITGQWIQPKGSQQARISVSRLSNGTEVLLYIARPVLTDVGLYICRAGQNEAHIEVAIDETALPYDIYLTSDDGILRVRSGGQNTTTAAVWNIAENNKYGPVSLAADCNSKRLIYTSDYGNTIRWGETDGRHKASVTHRLFTSQMSRFRHLAVDPPSGNIFAWDEGLGNIVLLNPNKPDMRYTLEKITSLRHDTAIRFAGLAVHSTKGLLYWAMFADGWMPNGTIQVASMTGENEKQVIQLSGEPLALSLSPLVENSGASTGRLCWIQRSITNTFALITELYCGRLSADGRSLLMQERVRQYRASEEPSWGLIHHGNTVLWTDATRTMYFSANPSRSVRVRHVCCSNRFQSIAVLANCQSALNNACGFSNGRCRYFCLPGDQLYRTCVCPDGEPGCHKEI